MGWEYSDFSHKAKEHGGPEQYIKDIEQYTQQETNQKWVRIVIPFIAAVTPFIVKGVVDTAHVIVPKIRKIANRDNVTSEDVQKAKKELTEHYVNSESEMIEK